MRKGCEAHNRAPESGEALSFFNQAATKDDGYRELVRSLSLYKSQMNIIKVYIAGDTVDKTFAFGLASKALEEKAVIDSFCLQK